MTVTSANVVLELQYWFSKFLFSSILNKNQIPYPSEIKEDRFTNDRSFIRLLFDDDWPTDFLYYNYMFYEYNISRSSPPEVSRRISIYPSPKIYLTSDDGNVDLFNLTDNDLFMLDLLLDYRLGDSTSVEEIIIDSTSDQETVLSTLIYRYLDLVINGNYENFGKSLKCNDILTCLYEVYVTEKMFEYVSNKGP